jgi:hypothetical protein
VPEFPAERGLSPASTPSWQAELKRHKCRAPAKNGRGLCLLDFPFEPFNMAEISSGQLYEK